jgi:sugar lactone lactonase YvrE
MGADLISLAFAFPHPRPSPCAFGRKGLSYLTVDTAFSQMRNVDGVGPFFTGSMTLFAPQQLMVKRQH